MKITTDDVTTSTSSLLVELDGKCYEIRADSLAEGLRVTCPDGQDVLAHTHPALAGVRLTVTD